MTWTGVHYLERHGASADMIAVNKDGVHGDSAQSHRSIKVVNDGILHGTDR